MRRERSRFPKQPEACGHELCGLCVAPLAESSEGFVDLGGVACKEAAEGPVFFQFQRLCAWNCMDVLEYAAGRRVSGEPLRDPPRDLVELLASAFDKRRLAALVDSIRDQDREPPKQDGQQQDQAQRRGAPGRDECQIARATHTSALIM